MEKEVKSDSGGAGARISPRPGNKTPPTSTATTPTLRTRSKMQQFNLAIRDINKMMEINNETGRLNTVTSSSTRVRDSPHSTTNTSPPQFITKDSSPTSSDSGGKQLLKLKRFFFTLLQFAQEVSTEASDRVRNLIFNLVTNAVSIEEFHSTVQELTSYPLRPFVIPFLKTNLPYLQREVHTSARVNKMNPITYLRTNQNMVFDCGNETQTPPHHMFLCNDFNDNGKRSRPDSILLENGVSGDSSPPPAKRHNGLVSPPLVSSSPSAFPSDSPFRPFILSPRRECQSTEGEKKGDEEWKNIHVMLNCILSMVEKTKRALTILQHRQQMQSTLFNSNQDPSGDLSVWSSRLTEFTDPEVKKVMAHTIKTTEDRVSEVKKKAEEAVAEVKRQALTELQRAVTAAESRASEMVAAERTRMNKLLNDSRISSIVPQTMEGSENCWNCGRKASETCSGCNTARYCGAFCQHKDWETHHRVCGTTVNSTTPANGRSPVVTVTLPDLPTTQPSSK